MWFCFGRYVSYGSICFHFSRFVSVVSVVLVVSVVSVVSVVLVVSVVSVVSFRSFWSFRWFRWFRFGRFVSLFRVLVHAMFSTTSCVCNLGSLKTYLFQFFFAISGDTHD